MRLISDGTPTGTHIYDDQGTDITRTMKVRGVTFSHKAGEGPTIQIDVIPEIIEITGLGQESAHFVKITP